MSNLIVVSGKKGSGKDTFYTIASEYLHEKGIGKYENRKFATKLKQTASLLTGLPIHYFYDRDLYSTYLPEWGMTIREFQQKLGTDAMRFGLHKDCWVIALYSDYKQDLKWIVSDCRFKNEADKSTKLKGVLIRINRHSVDDGDDHYSEVDLDDYTNWDYVIENDGTYADYVENVKKVLDSIFNIK